MVEPETKQTPETPKKSEEVPVEPTPEEKIVEDSEEWKKAAERLAQSREDRVRTQYSKQVKDLQKEIELMKMEKMSENEKREYEAKQLKEALDAKDRDLTRREMELLAVKTLEEKKLPSTFIDFVVGDNEEITQKRISQLEKVFAEELKSAVEIKIKDYGRAPHKGRGGDTNSFEGMSPKQIQEKARLEPDWFRQNESAIMEAYKGGYKK